MSNSNSWWSGKINHENFFFFFFPHFHYSSDVPTSKFGISIRRMEFFIGFLKFLPMRCRIVCIYLDELFRMLCQGWINLSKGAKGIFKFEMVVYWQKGICLPLSALPSVLKFDVLWQGYTSLDDTRFSIPRFTILAIFVFVICQMCSLNKNWNLLKKKKICSVWIIRIQKYRGNMVDV